MKKIGYLGILCVLLFGCGSSKIWVKDTEALKDTKLGTAYIKMVDSETDEYMSKASKDIQETLNPYLLESGFKVVNIDPDEREEAEAIEEGENQEMDYVMVGTGTVKQNFNGNTVQDFSLKLINVETQEIELTATYDGSGPAPHGFAKKMGKKIKEKFVVEE